ncbi:LysR family transcriptional regulator [Caulobacter sp. RL271]|jgi:DNA-binding transcriptional LysR family regulator|uniref:LysR family transcriptional regulator n=1 Tax=Caulobacter segnis TaxID=88688 RepID=A0ABY5A2Q6_9CAUL|nr:LysR family transcriptional regulator [Caulobacter segnis]USQ98406.1 LysR family transcriptional regulator [Caulobacter segnis]
MSKLPDLEGLAVFAKVVELRSFAAAAEDLAMSKATVSKAVTRLEERLGARLFNRTSRRLALTDAGQSLVERAARVLAEAQAAEEEASSQSSAPRGVVRMAVPMSLGITSLGPVLPGFFTAYPDVSVELHLSDATIDLVGMGFDLALRVAALPDSSLVARRLRAVKRHVVASSGYWAEHGRPTHPASLAEHRGLTYGHQNAPETWRFQRSGEEAAVRPRSVIRANNGDVLVPSLIAGVGVAVLPDFIVGAAVADGRLEAVLTDWIATPIALHLVMPPGGPRPARVEALANYLAKALGR